MAAPKTALNFAVHSVSSAEFAAKADIGGRTLDVKVPGLIVELVSEDGSMSQTLRLAADQLGVFDGAAEGDTVTANYTRTPAE